MDHILPGMDKDISSEFLKILKKQGINFKLDCKVTETNILKDRNVVNFTENKSKKKEKKDKYS